MFTFEEAIYYLGVFLSRQHPLLNDESTPPCHVPEGQLGEVIRFAWLSLMATLGGTPRLLALTHSG